MGALNDKPLTCPLCLERRVRRVTLKCGHCFCQACVTELWSGCPSGPYHCPECNYQHHTLPGSFWDGASTSTGRTGPAPDWTFGLKLSGAKSLLGKRKSSSTSEQHRSASSDNGVSGADVIDIIDSDEDTPTSSKKRVTREDHHPRGTESPVLLKSETPEASTSSADPPSNPSPDVPPDEPPSSSDPEGPLADLQTQASDLQVSSRPVTCHYCAVSEQKVAVKTCLVCGASMCPEHLRAHLETPVFQKHPLVDAVEDVSLWRCQEHQEINRIYCRSCAVCVCTVCSLVGSHRGHECISIREAEQELRVTLKDEMKKILKTKTSIEEKVCALKEKKRGVEAGLREARCAVLQQYQAMREALEQEEQQAVRCVEQEQQRVMGSINRQLDTLDSAHTASHALLNSLRDMTSAHCQDQAFIMEYRKLDAQLDTLGEPLERLEAVVEVDAGRLECLQQWTESRLEAVLVSMPQRDPFRLLYGICPTLDPDTAHPRLVLSEENRVVTYSETQQDLTDLDTRFSIFPQVLSCHALGGDCCYWEVEVSLDEGRWKVGISDGQIGRKGQKDQCRLGFYPHSWCLVCEKGKVEALHDKASAPVCASGLSRVGIMLDFTQGRLLFFSVCEDGGLSLLHSFQHTFTAPLYPALAVSKTRLRVCDVFAKSDAD